MAIRTAEAIPAAAAGDPSGKRTQGPAGRRDARWWWGVLVAYALGIYACLPIGPGVGGAVIRSSVGAWLFGSGTVVLTAGGAALILLALRRQAASWWWFAQLAVVTAGYVVALSWLHTYRLERFHLPEYGVAAWLSWQAVAPLLRTSSGRYTAAAAVASVIGVGDEVLQMFVPGRVFDPRDIVANVVAVLLGLALLPVLRAALSAESRA